MEDNSNLEINTDPRLAGLTNMGKGRPKGAVNKSTGILKEAIAELLNRNSESMDDWLKMVATGSEAHNIKPDPAKALDIMTKLSEYHIPKLARTEVAGDSEEPIEIRVRWGGDDDS
jgi:hypothetical protein